MLCVKCLAIWVESSSLQEWEETLTECEKCQVIFKQFQYISYKIKNLPSSFALPTEQIVLSPLRQLLKLIVAIVGGSIVLLLVNAVCGFFFNTSFYQHKSAMNRFKMLQLENSIQQDEIIEARANEEETEDFLSDEEIPPATGRAGSFLWRFFIKSVTPEESSQKVLNILKKKKLVMQSKKVVPGGIEIRLLMDAYLVEGLKEDLASLCDLQENSMAFQLSHVTSKSDLTLQQEALETFSWFKIQSKKKIEPGKAMVMIWITQPTSYFHSSK